MGAPGGLFTGFGFCVNVNLVGGIKNYKRIGKLQCCLYNYLCFLKTHSLVLLSPLLWVFVLCTVQYKPVHVELLQIWILLTKLHYPTYIWLSVHFNIKSDRKWISLKNLKAERQE